MSIRLWLCRKALKNIERSNKSIDKMDKFIRKNLPLLPLNEQLVFSTEAEISLGGLRK